MIDINNTDVDIEAAKPTIAKLSLEANDCEKPIKADTKSETGLNAIDKVKFLCGMVLS